MSKLERTVLVIGQVGQGQFGNDCDLSEVLLRQNVPLSERLDSGDEPFGRMRLIKQIVLRREEEN